MKTPLNLWIVSALLGAVFTPALHAQITAFTYQGQLAENGDPFTGQAEFRATLWTALSGGSQIATNSPPVVSVSVTNGLFVLPLDFGAAPFTTDAGRWLKLEVSTSLLQQFFPLSPRQSLTATPRAIHAQSAANSDLFHGLEFSNFQLKAELSGYTGNANTTLGRDAAIGLPPTGGTASGGGYMNTAIGFEALFAGDFAHRTTAVGRGALRDSTSGWLNVAVGTDAGRHTVLGHRNTFVGSNAGKWVGSLNPQADAHPRAGAPGADPNLDYNADLPDQGSRNTLIGRNAGHEGTQIQSCVAVGYNAGAHWLQNSSTTAVGRNAMISNAESSGTVALGAFAMDQSTDGANHSVAIGFEALRETTGNNNVAIGAFAAERLVDGGQNIFIGEQCAALKTGGSDNVFVGRLAGEQNTNGSRNIFVGRMAGRTETGSNKLIIHNTSSVAPFLHGSMGDGGEWWLQVRGNVEPHADGAWTLGSVTRRWERVWALNGTIATSDAGLKTAIQDDDLGLEFIRELRPVVWNWRKDKSRADHRGFVAQDVAAALAGFKERRGFAGLVDEGGPMGLAMSEFIGPLVSAVQELDARNAVLEVQMDKLQGSPPAAATVAGHSDTPEPEARIQKLEAANAELKQELAELKTLVGQLAKPSIEGRPMPAQKP